MEAGRLEREIKQGKRLILEAQVFLNLVRTAEALARGESDLLRSHGLSGPQYNVLRILRGARPDGLKCAEVATRMVTRDPDVTRLLDRLQRAGHVSRSRSPEDRRVISVRISSRGLALVDALDAPLDDLLRRKLAHLPRPALRRLNALLEQARAGTP